MKDSLLILTILLFSHNGLAMDFDDSIEAEQKREVQRLQDRKDAYEIYQKELIEQDKARKSKAGLHKAIRKKYEDQQERARKNFNRVEKVFPIKAYRKFRKMRDRQASRAQSVRKNYVKMQDELEKVHEKSRYKINKMQEYEL